MLVGLVGALVYWIAIRANAAPLPAAAITLAATLLLTGAMHEDGLADTADGLGGKTREQKLEIMRDSRIGTFGACALAISLLLRWSTIADIAEPHFVAVALIAAHVAARACLPAFMHLVPPARNDGLSSGAGQPPFPSVIASLLLGTICLLFAFGPTGTAITLLMLFLAALLLARLATRQFGGQTGDVLGAMEQIGECRHLPGRGVAVLKCLIRLQLVEGGREIDRHRHRIVRLALLLPGARRQHVLAGELEFLRQDRPAVDHLATDARTCCAGRCRPWSDATMANGRRRRPGCRRKTANPATIARRRHSSRSCRAARHGSSN